MTEKQLDKSVLSKTHASELKHLGVNYSLSLSDVAEVHHKMKQIVKGSNRLYVISLNAMFASRSAANGATGFVEVTALLRDFSQRLDNQVAAITIKINSLIHQSAALIKKKRLNHLMQQAVDQSDEITPPEKFILDNKKIYEEIEKISVEFTRQLSRCERILQIGENLAVLAKVEAVASDDDGHSLTPITTDMTETITHIGECLTQSQHIFAA